MKFTHVLQKKYATTSRNMAGLERLCHCLQSLLRVGVAQGVEHSLVQDLRIVMINVATATLQHPQYLYPGKKND